MTTLPQLFTKAQDRIFRPIVRNYIDPMFVRHQTRYENIYHCSQQRCGSRWILNMLRDIEVYKHCGLDVFDPRTNFVAEDNQHLLAAGFLPQRIISPVYARYCDFQKLKKPSSYRAFSVVRDPRDLVVSKLFSQKFSHGVISDFIKTRREILSKMDDQEGIAFVLEDSMPMVIESLATWCEATQDKNLRLLKYEDLVGPNQFDVFRELFDFLDVRIPDANLISLLDKHSFERLAGGRPQGEEDQKSHYRKGTPGDWRNHFDESHREQTKTLMGEVLIQLGYEQDLDW